MNADISPAFQLIIVIISMASMTVGNNGETSKRKTNTSIFRYITCWFMLMTLLNTTNTAGTLLYYTSAYALAGIAAFSVIIYVQRQ
jgi:NADH-quinone oxidoreductase subunit N